MAMVEGWLPASRQNYEFVLFWWNFYPILCSLQWLTSWYGMGKTSTQSRLNIPGRIAWFTMECPGFLTLLYIMNTLPAQQGITNLPWQNKMLGSLFVLHYLYRAVAFPFIQPSMSPIHILVWLAAIMFQLVNATCIGSWLAAYGPTTQEEWRTEGWSVLRLALGLVVFAVGLIGNYSCDEELREIRRKEQRRREAMADRGKEGVGKHYSVPQNGLFKYMLYPHYFMEWIEWTGFWILAGWACGPARAFLLNEFFAMWPRAVSGKKWYIDKFGEEKIKGKYAVIPGLW